MKAARSIVLLALILAGGASADQEGLLTYTYDISGFDAFNWWVAPGSDYRHDVVQWATTSRSAIEPYPLNGAGGGWSYRRKGDYPGFVLGENGWQSNGVDESAASDEIVGTGAGYDNTAVPTDRTVEMYYRGKGHYAGDVRPDRPGEGGEDGPRVRRDGGGQAGQAPRRGRGVDRAIWRAARQTDRRAAHRNFDTIPTSMQSSEVRIVLCLSLVFNAEGVRSRSPGSRSAPWVE